MFPPFIPHFSYSAYVGIVVSGEFGIIECHGEGGWNLYQHFDPYVFLHFDARQITEWSTSRISVLTSCASFRRRGGDSRFCPTRGSCSRTIFGPSSTPSVSVQRLLVFVPVCFLQTKSQIISHLNVPCRLASKGPRWARSTTGRIWTGKPSCKSLERRRNPCRAVVSETLSSCSCYGQSYWSINHFLFKVSKVSRQVIDRNPLSPFIRWCDML